MAYTAELLRAVKENGKWSINIRYTDENGSIEKGYTRPRATTNSIKRLALKEIADLDGVKSDPVITLGSIDLTPIPDPTPDPPTQEEIDREAWLVEWEELQGLQKVIAAIPALGTTARNNRIATLQASLETGYKKPYLGFI